MKDLNLPTLIRAGSLLAVTLLAGCSAVSHQENVAADAPTLTTIAVRIHNMRAMTAFYEEAFGIKFKEVNTSGLRSQFGSMNGVTFKFVPLRQSADFVDFPSHQVGINVDDVDRIVELAKKHGGRQEGELGTVDGMRHASVRDPDGNTIEVYSPMKSR